MSSDGVDAGKLFSKAASRCPKVVYLYSLMLQINFRGLDTTYPRPSCDVKKSYDLYYFLGSSLLVETGVGET